MAADWTYAPEGTTYPVAPGDTWQVGPHLFHCSDLMADRTFDDLLSRLRPPDLLYCDPPWNQSNVNSFRTKARLDPADHRWDDLYRRIITLTPPGRPMYLEGGNRQAAHVRTLLQGVTASSWPITYYRRHPCTLHYSGPAHPNPDFTGLDDDDTPAATLRSWPNGGCVLDPTAGRGLISRAAHLTGWSSINNELNPYRLSVALVRLNDLTGHLPHLLHPHKGPTS